MGRKEDIIFTSMHTVTSSLTRPIGKYRPTAVVVTVLVVESHIAVMMSVIIQAIGY